MNVISRRHFLKLAGASTALVAADPTMLRAQSATPKGRVVVVGGGFGGATVAKYLRLWGGNSAAVTLVDANPNHVSCILSNMVLDGSLNSVSYTHLDVYKRQLYWPGCVAGRRAGAHAATGRDCPGGRTGRRGAAVPGFDAGIYRSARAV